jgi:peptidoglycan hydrolase-like protein with peptidoglycan-binding domain
MRRRTLAMVVVGAVLVSSLVTWVASAQIRSPAEVAARAAPPEASPILARVERRVLATTIVSRGTGRYGSPRNLTVTPSELDSGPQVVTTRPRTATTLREGDVVLTISGRPVFLLVGSQPSYRDLGPGIRGADVLQLERALARLRYRPGRVDGYYDYATGAAVTRMYAARGFRPVVASDGQLDAVRPTEAELVRGSMAHGGVQFPADEVVFAGRPPLRVTRVPVALGAAPEGAVVTVTDSVVSVDGTVPVEEARLLRVGAKVRVDEPALEIDTAGTVTHVADRPGTEGADGFHVAFRVVVPKAPPAVVGASVRLTVTVESTRQEELTVPVSALSLGPDGASRVQRSVHGRLTFVPVQPGLSADGFVVITPRGQLAEGDAVVIGVKGGG